MLLGLDLRRSARSPAVDVLDGASLPAPLAPLDAEVLRDVQRVDVIQRGALAPLGGHDPLGALGAEHHPDRLRLPPPPVRAPDGHALFMHVGRAVARFQRTESQPVAASAEVVVREAKLMGLLRGIHDLETQIRAEISRA
jgi:hypothetical protein